MAYGIMMNGGSGDAILKCLRDLEAQEITYVELGVAAGETFAEVVKFLESLKVPFTCWAVDIEEGWSLNKEAISRMLTPNAQLSLVGSQKFLLNQEFESIDFIWIDACHGKECCKNDFLLSEACVKVGGYVGFHDTADFCQNQDEQPHCKKPIQVLEALKELDLLDGTRFGWKLYHEVVGDPKTDNGCMIFKRVK